jgi:hypothetical protein
MKKFVVLFASLTAIGAICFASGVVGGGGGGGGGSSVWGAITGTLSDQTDLNTSLSAKQSTTLADGKVLVGNGSNIATAVTPSGDVTITNAGVTAIGATKVTNAMLAGSIQASKLVGTDIATVGTITSGTWNGTSVAGAYQTAMVGDSGAGGTKGAVPAPSAGDAAASKYLKADGTWATVSASASPPFTGDGTESAPAYAGAGGNSNSGIYSPGTDQTAIAFNGQKILELNTKNLLIFGTGASAGGQEPVFRFNTLNLSTGGEWTYNEYYDGNSGRTRRHGINVLQGGLNGVLSYSIGSNMIHTVGNNGSVNFGMNADQGTYTANGTDGVSASGVAYTSATAVGNVGAGEDTLHSKSMGAKMFWVPAQSVEMEAFGTIAANANAKRLKAYFGTCAVYDWGAISPNGGEYHLKVKCATVAASNAQTCVASLQTDNATVADRVQVTACTETETAAIVIKTTAEAVSDNDISEKFMQVKWYPAGGG